MSNTETEEAFAPYIDAVRTSFAFLEPRGYGAPRVSVRAPRECTVVYWGDERANVAVYQDLGGPPWVEIVPLSMVRDDGSTRTFGLNEAIAALAPTPEPEPSADDRAWLEWYAAFLEAHLDAVTRPSTDLLDRIEAEREG